MILRTFTLKCRMSIKPSSTVEQDDVEQMKVQLVPQQVSSLVRLSLCLSTTKTALGWWYLWCCLCYQLASVDSVACGLFSSFAVSTSGELWAWGLNNYGQLAMDVGDGPAHKQSHYEPTKINSLGSTRLKKVDGKFISRINSWCYSLIQVLCVCLGFFWRAPYTSPHARWSSYVHW